MAIGVLSSPNTSSILEESDVRILLKNAPARSPIDAFLSGEMDADVEDGCGFVEAEVDAVGELAFSRNESIEENV